VFFSLAWVLFPFAYLMGWEDNNKWLKPKK
jgi:hypothetical protein